MPHSDSNGFIKTTKGKFCMPKWDAFFFLFCSICKSGLPRVLVIILLYYFWLFFLCIYFLVRNILYTIVRWYSTLNDTLKFIRRHYSILLLYTTIYEHTSQKTHSVSTNFPLRNQEENTIQEWKMVSSRYIFLWFFFFSVCLYLSVCLYYFFTFSWIYLFGKLDSVGCCPFNFWNRNFFWCFFVL